MANDEIRIVLNTADFQDLVRGKEIRGSTREDCLATTTNYNVAGNRSSNRRRN